MVIKVQSALIVIGALVHVFAQSNSFFNVSKPTYSTNVNNFANSLTVSYVIGKGEVSGSYPDNVQVKLFNGGCDTTSELSLTGEVVEIIENPYAGGSSFDYEIKVDPAKITSTSSLVNFTDSNVGPSSSGAIEFCTRVTSHLDALGSVSLYTRLSDWEIGFNLTSLDINFLEASGIPSVASINVVDVDTTIPNTISLTGCQCSIDNYSCISSAISNGDVLYFCLIPSSTGVKISNFDLTLTNGNFNYKPIVIGSNDASIVSGPLTSIQRPSGNVVLIETVMVSNLFENPSSNTVNVSGNALLLFDSGSGKTNEIYQFDAIVEIEKISCNLASFSKKLLSDFKNLVQ